MNAKDRLIVALDIPDFEDAAEMVNALAEAVDIFKIGIAPFTGSGQDLLKYLSQKKKKVFLDLKFTGWFEVFYVEAQ